jgi:sec-independent protein translocase protein TatA
MPFNVGPLELIIILVIALLILGPGKLPEVGASLGKSIREFRKAVTDVSDATRVDVAPTPNQAQAPAPQQPAAPQVAAPQQPAAPQVAAPQPVEAPQPIQASQIADGTPAPNVISEQAAPNEIAGQPKS